MHAQILKKIKIHEVAHPTTNHFYITSIFTEQIAIGELDRLLTASVKILCHWPLAAAKNLANNMAREMALGEMEREINSRYKLEVGRFRGCDS